MQTNPTFSGLGPAREPARAKAFYGDVLQHLKAWTAAPPRLREATGSPELKPPALVSTALSSQDGVELVGDGADSEERTVLVADAEADVS